MKAWHVTNVRNREAIATEGLRTDVMGWDTGYVWFFLDPTQAMLSAATGAWGGSRGNNDIWEIDLDGYDVLDDPHQAWGEDRSNRCVAHSIPAECLRLLDSGAEIVEALVKA